MPDRKLTYDKLPDGEIKKVLECCLYGDCQDCFYGDTDQRCCRDDLMQNCLEYFNRLQAENERLQNTLDDVLDRQPLLVERSEKYAKAEAYKEYHKRFEKNIKDVQVTLGQTWEIQNALKKTYKEMVGEDNGT